MAAIIPIDSVTAVALRRGDFQKELPEYYALRQATEINGWHDHQNVFDHVVLVYEHLEKLLTLDFLSRSRLRIAGYLNQSFGKFTRRQLLLIATILHDIAKKDTLVTDANGKTRCPGHELVGSGMVSIFSARFNLDSRETDQVRKLVLYHDLPHNLLDISVRKSEDQTQFKFLTQTVSDIWPELLLLVYADMQASDVVTAFPDEFRAREKLLIFWLETY